MPKILISYRRLDTDAIAGRIHDRLSAYYGDDAVYIDIDSIPYATDFRDHIQDALRKSDIMLAIVGPQWLGKEGDRSRIQDESDPVRIEIESALEHGLPVMPILVGGARMPQPADLPKSMEKFSYLNAPVVDAGRDFRQHMDRVIRFIDQQFATPAKKRVAFLKKRAPWLVTAAGAGVVGIAALVMVLQAERSRQAQPPLAIPQTAASPAGARAGASATEIVVDLSQVRTAATPVAARPYLKDHGISVTDITPPNSEVVIANNRAIYGGAAIRPSVSENFLMQIETGNVVASYTLRFDEPVDSVRFIRPTLFRDTDSGITHPAWTATAMDAAGRSLSSQSEGLLRSHRIRVGDTSAQTYVLRAPGFERIAAVRFESDPRLEGKPFAAFSALVIEQITLVRLRP